MDIIWSLLKPIFRVAKILTHGFQERAILGLISEALYDGIHTLRLVYIRKASVLLVCPLIQFIPTTTHPNLPLPCRDIRCRGCVEWGIFGFTDNILHEMVHAVYQVSIIIKLWAIIVVKYNRPAEFALLQLAIYFT